MNKINFLIFLFCLPNNFVFCMEKDFNYEDYFTTDFERPTSTNLIQRNFFQTRDNFGDRFILLKPISSFPVEHMPHALLEGYMARVHNNFNQFQIAQPQISTTNHSRQLNLSNSTHQTPFANDSTRPQSDLGRARQENIDQLKGKLLADENLMHRYHDGLRDGNPILIEKINEVNNATQKALSTLKSLTNTKNNDPQKYLDFINITIPQQHLNKQLLEAKNQINNIIFDFKNKKLRNLTPKNIEAINTAILTFEKYVEFWHEKLAFTILDAFNDEKGIINFKHLKKETDKAKIESFPCIKDQIKINDFLNEKNISNTPLNREIARNVIEIEQNFSPQEVVRHLSTLLSTDHENPYYRAAYRQWFNQNGECKLYDPNSAPSELLPKTIHNKEHAAERQLLFELKSIDISTEQGLIAYQHVADYINNACTDEINMESYRALANAALTAIKYEGADQVILECNNLSQAPFEQEVVSKVLPITAEISKIIYNPLSEASLKELDTARNLLVSIDSLIGQLQTDSSEQARNQLKTYIITPHLSPKVVRKKEMDVSDMMKNPSNNALFINSETSQFLKKSLERTKGLADLVEPLNEVSKPLSPSLARKIAATNIGLDLMKTAKQEAPELKRIPSLPELDIHNPSLEKELQESLASLSKKESLIDDLHKANLQIISSINELQHLAAESNDPNKFEAIVVMEVLKKTVSVADSLTHPIETAGHIIEGAQKVGMTIARLVKLMANKTYYMENPEQMAVVLEEEIATAKAIANLPTEEKVKLGVDVLYDFGLQHQLNGVLGSVKNTLVKTYNELNAISTAENLALETQGLAGLKAIESTVQQEINAIETLEHASQSMKMEVPEIIATEANLIQKQNREINANAINTGSPANQILKTITHNSNLTNIIKQDINITKKIYEHIFSKDHIRRGIMRINESKDAILQEFCNLILEVDQKKLLSEGVNTILTKVNEIEVVIKPTISNGKIIMIDAFIRDQKVNLMGNIIHYTNE